MMISVKNVEGKIEMHLYSGSQQLHTGRLTNEEAIELAANLIWAARNLCNATRKWTVKEFDDFCFENS